MESNHKAVETNEERGKPSKPENTIEENHHVCIHDQIVAEMAMNNQPKVLEIPKKD